MQRRLRDQQRVQTRAMTSDLFTFPPRPSSSDLNEMLPFSNTELTQPDNADNHSRTTTEAVYPDLDLILRPFCTQTAPRALVISQLLI